MNAKVSQWEERTFFFKVYRDLWHTEKAVKIVRKNIASTTQLSILGRFPAEVVNDNVIELLKSYKKQLLDPKVEYGFFFNPQIGNLFIIGPLASVFLHEMNGRVLGALSMGF